MPAKILVTESRGGSRISLLSNSGKELLTSVVFHEPRAKGATLRSLKGLLGEVTIEDQTLSTIRKAKPEAALSKPSRRSVASGSAAKTPGRQVAKATKAVTEKVARKATKATRAAAQA